MQSKSTRWTLARMEIVKELTALGLFQDEIARIIRRSRNQVSNLNRRRRWRL